MGLANMINYYNGVANTSVSITKNILDEFRDTVGKCRPETGGMIACSCDLNIIDRWCFDYKSVNTAASYSYDVQEMSAQFKRWKDNGIKSVGFVHSHPDTYRHPSFDDIATARALMKFFKNDFFYLPIIISDKKGWFTMYFFVVRQVGEKLNVNLDYVQKATCNGYEIIPFRKWENNYYISDVEAYYDRVNVVADNISTNTFNKCGSNASVGDLINNIMTPTYTGNTFYSITHDNFSTIMDRKLQNIDININGEKYEEYRYFERIKGMYPDKVLDKVIICVGTGGVRSTLENMARNGFRNFVLIDGDKVSPSNIATQGVFISEMGMWKTEAIRARIKDINPSANVICINRFLDDDFSDEEFSNILADFKGKESTEFLVLGCCDTFEGNRRSSELSLKYGLLYIGAGMYQNGLAAEIIFTYPGVTSSCPRCMLRSRYEAYEDGYRNDVTSVGCSTFATERLNTLIGFISIMMLMYNEDSGSCYNQMLNEVKERNFVWIRMSPYLSQSELGIGIFDRVFAANEAHKYTFFDETIWIPQHPDSPEFGEETCKLCGGVGDLRKLKYKLFDTRCSKYKSGDLCS